MLETAVDWTHYYSQGSLAGYLPRYQQSQAELQWDDPRWFEDNSGENEAYDEVYDLSECEILARWGDCAFDYPDESRTKGEKTPNKVV